MTRPFKSFLFVASVCLAALSSSALALPFQNGSFETPVIPSGTFYDLGNSSWLAGWVSTTSGFPQTWTQNYVYNTGFDAVSDGSQAVLFNGDGMATTTLYQAFDTTPGLPYVVTFDLKRQPGSTATPPTISLQATGGSATIYAASSQTFIEETYDFIAVGSGTTLTFTQWSGPDLSPEVDNVVVRAVPEPTTLGLFALGLGGALARRRRR